MNKNEYNDYKSLVCGIIEQQVIDYAKSTGNYRNIPRDKAKLKFINYINNCRWFEYLDINKEVLINKALRLRRETDEKKKRKKEDKKNKENNC